MMFKSKFAALAIIATTMLGACSAAQQAQVQVDAAAVCQLGALAVQADPALAKHNATAVNAATQGCAAVPAIGAIVAPAITKAPAS